MIYWLKPEVRQYDRLRYSASMEFSAKLCTGDPTHSCRHTRSEILRLVFPSGVQSDFSWTSYDEPIVTVGVMKFFEAAGISGCEFRTVELENTSGDSLSVNLFELRSTGWGGVASKESGIRVEKECRFCKRRVFSVFTDAESLLDIDSWDGSDMFTIWPLPRYIFVTEELRELIDDAEFTGVKMVRVEEMPVSAVGGYSPGSIFDWFEQKRAVELEREIERSLQDRLPGS